MLCQKRNARSSRQLEAAPGLSARRPKTGADSSSLGASTWHFGLRVRSKVTRVPCFSSHSTSYIRCGSLCAEACVPLCECHPVMESESLEEMDYSRWPPTSAPLLPPAPLTSSKAPQPGSRQLFSIRGHPCRDWDARNPIVSYSIRITRFILLVLGGQTVLALRPRHQGE